MLWVGVLFKFQLWGDTRFHASLKRKCSRILQFFITYGFYDGITSLYSGISMPPNGILISERRDSFCMVFAVGFQRSWTKHILLLPSRTRTGAEESHLRTRSAKTIAKILRGKGGGDNQEADGVRLLPNIQKPQSHNVEKQKKKIGNIEVANSEIQNMKVHLTQETETQTIPNSNQSETWKQTLNTREIRNRPVEIWRTDKHNTKRKIRNVRKPRSRRARSHKTKT